MHHQHIGDLIHLLVPQSVSHMRHIDCWQEAQLLGAVRTERPVRALAADSLVAVGRKVAPVADCKMIGRKVAGVGVVGRMVVVVVFAAVGRKVAEVALGRMVAEVGRKVAGVVAVGRRIVAVGHRVGVVGRKAVAVGRRVVAVDRKAVVVGRKAVAALGHKVAVIVAVGRKAVAALGRMAAGVDAVGRKVVALAIFVAAVGRKVVALAVFVVAVGHKVVALAVFVVAVGRKVVALAVLIVRTEFGCKGWLCYCVIPLHWHRLPQQLHCSAEEFPLQTLLVASLPVHQ